MLVFENARKKNQMLGSSTRIIPLLTVLVYFSPCALAQDKPPDGLQRKTNVAALNVRPQASAPSIPQSVSISDAVAIFLRQNFQLIAARYDIDSAEAEKLTARLRPNPDVSVGFSGLPLNLSGNLLTEQQYSYAISQSFELGGKRAKRIDVANKNSDVARAQFETAVWELTNDLKRKLYTVILNRSLLNLAQENQKTFAEVIEHTKELVQAGEGFRLDLTRLEGEKIKLDTGPANGEREYEVALRGLRVTPRGDYRAMEIDPTGTLDPQVYDFTFTDLRDQALAARPDLKAAKVAERAADASIRLQDAQKIPDVNLGGGVTQVPGGTSNYTFGVGVALPVHDRNQGERAK